MNIAAAIDTPDVAPLRLLHADETIVAIDKLAGLLVHRSSLDAHETRSAPSCVRSISAALRVSWASSDERCTSRPAGLSIATIASSACRMRSALGSSVVMVGGILVALSKLSWSLQ